MLGSIKTFIADKRPGLTKTVTVVGGLYLVKRFVTNRLDDAKERMEQDKISRDMCVFFLSHSNLCIFLSSPLNPSL